MHFLGQSTRSALGQMRTCQCENLSIPLVQKTHPTDPSHHAQDAQHGRDYKIAHTHPGFPSARDRVSIGV